MSLAARLPIQPEDRWKILWDSVVFVTITIAAFEVPYSMIIGWSDTTLRMWFDAYIYGVFVIDLLLNFVTVRDRSYAGLWDWRDFVGVLRWSWSADGHRAALRRDATQPLKAPRVEEWRFSSSDPIWKDYVRSKWIWIDVVSVIPFELLSEMLGFNTLARLLRLARIPRLIRLVRAVRVLRVLKVVKGLGISARYRSLIREHPAVLRFYALGILVPWCIHVSACLLCLDAPTPATGELYWTKVAEVFTAMKDTDMPVTESTLGACVGFFVMFSGLAFFGTFIGNFASLFANMDNQGAAISAAQNRWVRMFRKYPEVFLNLGTDVRRSILAYARDEVLLDDTVDEDYALICALGDELEMKVRVAFEAARFQGLPAAPAHRLKSLLDQDDRVIAQSEGAQPVEDVPSL